MKRLLTVVLSIILTSYTDAKTIRVHVEESDTINLSELIESITIVPLYSDSFFRLSDIGMVWKDDSMMLVKNKSYSNAYVFGADCNYKADLCSQSGHRKVVLGDDKLCKLSHRYAVDTQQKLIYMTGNGSGGLYKFDYSGNLVEELQLNSNPGFIIPVRQGLVFTSNAHEDSPDGVSRLTFYHNGRQLVYNKVCDSKKFNDIDVSYLRHKTLLHFHAEDTIFSISYNKARFNVEYVIDFDDKTYRKDISKMNLIDAQKYVQSHNDNAGYVHNVHSNKDLLWFSYYYNGKEFTYILDRQNGKHVNGIVYDDLFLNGDIDVVGNTEDGFILAVNDPWHFIARERFYERLSDKETEWINNISEDTDYFLIIVRCKL